MRYYLWQADRQSAGSVRPYSPNWSFDWEECSFECIEHCLKLDSLFDNGDIIGTRDWDPDLSMEVNPYYRSGGIFQWTDVLSSKLNAQLHSSRLKLLLMQLGFSRAIQYLPVDVHDFYQKARRYYIANYRVHLRAVNPLLSRDVFEPSREIALVLCAEVVNEVPIFIAKWPIEPVEHWNPGSYVVIREDVKKAIESSGMTGCQFTDVDLA